MLETTQSVSVLNFKLLNEVTVVILR